MAIQAFPLGFAGAALQYGVVTAPLLAYGLIRKSKGICFAACFTFGLGLIQTVILYLPNLGALSELKFNWLQKALAFAVTVLLARSTVFRKVDSGLSLPKNIWAIPSAIFIGLLFASYDAFSASDQSAASHSALFDEKFWFELTMPGLQEEPLFRGLLLGVLDEHLGRPFKALGVKFGLGCVVTTLIFTIGHLVQFDDRWHLMVAPDVALWLNFIIFCLLMCWLRYRFNSVWPSVLAHNIDNAGGLIIAHFIQRN